MDRNLSCQPNCPQLSDTQSPEQKEEVPSIQCIGESLSHY